MACDDIYGDAYDAIRPGGSSGVSTMVRPPKPDWRASSGRVRNWGDSGYTGLLVGKAALDPFRTSAVQFSRAAKLYSITSSACASRLAGMASPSVFAVRC
jgi:hypothetical protein